MWLKTIAELFNCKDCGNNAWEIDNHFKSFLHGKAREDFLMSLKKSQEFNRTATTFKLSQKTMMARALNAAATRIFTTSEFAAAIQRRYLWQWIPFGDTNVVDYVDRLCKLNSWFIYFPVENDKIKFGNADEFPQPLPEDELMDILCCQYEL